MLCASYRFPDLKVSKNSANCDAVLSSWAGILWFPLAVYCLSSRAWMIDPMMTIWLHAVNEALIPATPPATPLRHGLPNLASMIICFDVTSLHSQFKVLLDIWEVGQSIIIRHYFI